MTTTNDPYRQESIVQWLYDNSGYHSAREIAIGLGVSQSAVRHAINRLCEQYRVVRFSVKPKTYSIVMSEKYRIQKVRDTTNYPSSPDFQPSNA